MSRHLRALAALALLCSSSQAQRVIKPRPLGPVLARSTELLAAVSVARQLPDGKVLLNDVKGRRVLLFADSLRSFTVVADTTSATASAYGSRAGGLIGWHGDSTVFADPQSLSMLVIDGAGKIVRVLSAPPTADGLSLVGGESGFPGIDARGRLVYRGRQNRPGARLVEAGASGGVNGAKAAAASDSAPLVRFDFATRTIDTIAKLHTAPSGTRFSIDDKGQQSVTVTLNPLPLADDWAVLSDGTVAVLRPATYTIEWIRSDGTPEVTRPIPFDWVRLNDDGKAALLDSTRVVVDKVLQGALAGNLAAAYTPVGAAVAAANDFADGYTAGMASVGGSARPRPAPKLAIQVVPASELPDYVPAFTAGASRGDADGNLWVRTSTAQLNGAVYDVINAKGKLVDRLVVPEGRVIAGFGKGGVVYMGVREGAGVRLEMAKRP